MQEHLVQDNGPVRSSQLPPGVLIEEKFSVYPLLCFSHWESCFPGLLPGVLGFPYPPSIMQFQQTMVTKETIKTLHHPKWYNYHKATTKKCQSCWRMSYPQGTTSNNFHFGTIEKNTLLFSPDKSWQLANLLYHVLRLNKHFHLAIKINLLQLRNTHIFDILSKACIFMGLPHMLTS